MSSIINTNILSNITQNNLNKSQNSLSKAIERLSSGLRINSAKDDSAGQAIANRITSNVRGLVQAQRNANDGISLAQTAEGALTEINTNLQRVRELSVQALNGNNSKSDLDSIQGEITQRLAEIDRTSAQTDFNGTKVLGAGASSLKFQIGARDGETIDIGLKTINSSTLNVASFNVNGTGTLNTATSKNDLLMANYAVGATTNGTTAYTKTFGAADVANLSGVFGKAVSGDEVTSAIRTTIAKYTSTGSDFTFADTARATTDVKSDLVPAAGGKTANVSFTIGGTTTVADIDSNGQLTAAGTTTKLYLDSTGNLTQNSGGTLIQANVNGNGGTLRADKAAAVAAGDVLSSMGGATSGAGITGGSITVGSGVLPPTYVYTAAATTGTASATNLHITTAALATQVATDNAGGTTLANNVTVKLGVTAAAAPGGPAAITYQVDGATATKGKVTAGSVQVNVDRNNALTTATTESLFAHANGNVTDATSNTLFNDSANAGKFTLSARSGNTSTANALSVIDAALASVDSLRGALGAVQNRFESVISNLGTTVTNLTASRSRIEDADYATEVSNLTRANILQQAGTSVLAQANQSTQGVLALLR